MLAVMLMPYAGHASGNVFTPLQCENGQPVENTRLYDDTTQGACQFTGVEHVFSTIICQFISMVNVIMSKLYCSIQGAMYPVIQAVATVFIVVYGIQMLMGTAQMNGAEFVGRMVKIAIVLWLVTDPVFGVSAGISYMFTFFITFMSESTRWVVMVLDRGAGLGLNLKYSYNPGITATFYYIDDWLYNALTGSFSEANGKVVGFFIAMSTVIPSVAMMALYWLISVVKMLIATLLTFLMSVVCVAFLLGLSPIFLCFMLFRITYQYFDQWVRFMASYTLQVMVTFAILTLWMFSLTLFAPFFKELSGVVFPYEKVIRPAAGNYNPAQSVGLCPLVVSPSVKAKCIDPDFDPRPPKKKPKDGQDASKSARDFQKIIPPSKVPEMAPFLFYLFYHLISLIVVTYGFANLQKNASQIAKQLGGPSYVPILSVASQHTQTFNAQAAPAEANRFMAKDLFMGFSRRHNSGATPYEQMVGSFGKMAGNR